MSTEHANHDGPDGAAPDGSGHRPWNRRAFLRTSAAGAGAGFIALNPAPATAAPDGRAERPTRSGVLKIERTTVEYATTLLGTDVAKPRLAWELSAPGNGARQSAYQVRVSTEPPGDGGRPLWDSGRVESADTFGVPYAGPALKPRTRYHWQVRVWDGDGKPSEWSTARWWETALSKDDWQGHWIGAPAAPEPPGFEGASWIWSPGATPQDAPAGTRWFRGHLELPQGAEVSKAELVATADDDFTLYLDGAEVLHAPEQTDGWRTGRYADVTEQVRGSGAGIVLAARATNRGTAEVDPGGLLVRLVVQSSDGEHTCVTGAGWRSAEEEQQGWQKADFDDSGWPEAEVLVPFGEGPWGDDAKATGDELPAPLLRREFTVGKPITRARLYISGLAYYEAELNGRRVGRQVLDPGFTDYDKTVLYAVHDVTDLVRRGRNAIGVTLGRGFYAMTTSNVWNWHKPPWHGEPRLLGQLEIDHPDGTRSTVSSDGSWRMAEGPTLSNSQYAGETYDARKNPRGWTEPGFDDGDWERPERQDAPKGSLRAQPLESIEITDTVRPVAVTAHGDDWIVDMGRTMAGWTRLKVRAKAGTTVRLVHGEKLKDDGSVHAETEHVPGRFQTDEYVCAGDGDEVWEPKFSYKGFRYVQVSGLPEKPEPEQVLGRLVHSTVEDTGSFRCSEPQYEQFEKAMRRTVLNNLHGYPTDTPMFEKNGWTGDAQVGAPTMMYALGMHRFLGKWLDDLADSQNDRGQPPVIVPSGGWGYKELAPTPEWTTVYPFLVREMYRVYGDERVVRSHLPAVIRYLDYEIDRLEDGLAVTALGDWLPPGHPSGIPPEDTRLTATAYLHRALTDTADMADLVGEASVRDRYRDTAEKLKEAFNKEFLGPDGHYRTAKEKEYRQTNNCLPLAFGLVPAGARASAAASLVADIEKRGNHLNTGCLGTSVLLRALSAAGHPEVAHAVATQTTYPSWGYWFENGADTMWEMWELESRSRDHYFMGTVAQWLYENVAGLRPGDAGYRTFVVRPDARAGVNWARTELHSVRGPAEVAWSRIDKAVRLTVRVPVGSTAEVHVPAASKSAAEAPRGAKFVRTEPGHVVYQVGHGRWEFSGRP
ncbi:Bacterial alpha-L-rhamnosidase [Streptomyces sp. YIM 130001]|uniref:family 78 glycoside hydrolase catalytic domain n=1 Tax=Streptomyces sp. YIM 130001 TaxID=2259644 RepID=UPI000E6529A1|nr:family 78 glycoside hydrolase catalytic domain [Streptomyces sp. YIM 130001]RII14615.1 Bacterial alpha-L-rhamnosidase [Streptomyces sp. YIM 130001]